MNDIEKFVKNFNVDNHIRDDPNSFKQYIYGMLTDQVTYAISEQIGLFTAIHDGDQVIYAKELYGDEGQGTLKQFHNVFPYIAYFLEQGKSWNSALYLGCKEFTKDQKYVILW